MNQTGNQKKSSVLSAVKKTGLGLRVAAFLPRSRVNGPGARSVLWTQGCPRRCPGCFNPDFLPFEGGTVREADEVLDWIAARDDTEGVTFSGGEPFAQAAALAHVAEEAQNMGKSVVIFTGYDWETLQSNESSDPAWRALLVHTDALIAGSYRQEQPSRHPLLGSANQRIVCLTDRYCEQDFLTADSADSTDGFQKNSNPIGLRTTKGKRVEFRIAAGGEITITGFPTNSLSELSALSAVNPLLKKT